MSDEYESELTATREETATVLGDLADGLRAGSIRLGDGPDAVAVDVSEEISLDIELETEADELSLEIEMEWSPPGEGEPAVSPVDDPPEAEDDRATHAGAASDLQSLARFEVFRDRGGEWRWRLRHRNGNVIATSGEGYTRKHNAWKGLRSVVRNAPQADVTEE